MSGTAKYAIGDTVRIVRSKVFCCGTLRNGTEGVVEQSLETKQGWLYVLEGGAVAYEKELTSAEHRYLY